MRCSVFCTILSGSLWLAGPQSDVVRAGGDHTWIGDYGQAKELARKSNKPIFLVFR